MPKDPYDGDRRREESRRFARLFEDDPEARVVKEILPDLPEVKIPKKRELRSSKHKA